MNFALKIMDFTFKMVDLVFELMDFALKRTDFQNPDASKGEYICRTTLESVGDVGCLSIFEKTLAAMTVGGPFIAAFLHKRFFQLLWAYPK